MSFMSFVFFKPKTAYEMRISDWSSYVCSSDLVALRLQLGLVELLLVAQRGEVGVAELRVVVEHHLHIERQQRALGGHRQRIDLDEAGVELAEDRKSTRLKSSH